MTAGGDFAGQRPLQIEMRREADVPIVALSGSCTMEQSMRLGEELAPLAGDPTVKMLIIDLHDLDFIESSGLGGVIAAYLKCRKRGADLRLVGPAPAIRRVLEITQLDKILRICDNLETAMTAR